MNLSDLGREQYTQHDGAQWNVFYDKAKNPDKDFLLLTSSGREELLNPPESIGFSGIKEFIRAYRDAESGIDHDKGEVVREYLGQGQQATVYGLGSYYAVREVGGNPSFYNTLSDVTRANRLASIVQGGLPRWIDVPPIYAVYSDSSVRRQYTLMKRVDNGLTVDDIVNFDDSKNQNVSQGRALRQLGRPPHNEEKEKATELYDTAKDILSKVIKEKGGEPEELLSDWAMRNVLVDFVKTPVAGEKMIFHIIDQN